MDISLLWNLSKRGEDIAINIPLLTQLTARRTSQTASKRAVVFSVETRLAFQEMKDMNKTLILIAALFWAACDAAPDGASSSESAKQAGGDSTSRT